MKTIEEASLENSKAHYCEAFSEELHKEADMDFRKGIEFAQRWISVEEELPFNEDGDDSIKCLVKSNYDGIVVRPYNQYHKCWDQEDGDDYYSDAIGGKITHWRKIELL